MSNKMSRSSHLVALVFALCLPLASPPGVADTPIDCPQKRYEYRVVPDSAPSERFSVRRCLCGERADVLKGMNSYGTSPAYLNANTRAEIRAALIAELGLSPQTRFVVSRAPTQSYSSRTVLCLNPTELDGFVDAVKAVRDDQPIRLSDLNIIVKPGVDDDGAGDDEDTGGASLASGDGGDTGKSTQAAGATPANTGSDTAGSGTGAGATQAGDTPRIDQLRDKLKAARDYHKRTLTDLNQQIDDTKRRLSDAQQRLAPLLDQLKQRRAAYAEESLLGSIDIFTSDLFGSTDPAIVGLERRIASLKAQIAALATTLQTLEQSALVRFSEAAKLERRLQVEIIKLDPAARAAEQARRQQEAIDLQLEVNLRNVVTGEALKVFDAAIAAKQAKGARVRDGSADVPPYVDRAALADYIEGKAVDQVRAERARYLEAATAQLSAAGRALAEAFARNAREGIGPTGLADVAQQIVADGGDVKVVLKADTVTQAPDPDTGAPSTIDRLELARFRAQRLADGATASIDQTSVFLEINKQSIYELSRDATNTYIDYAKNPEKFFKGFGAYSKGAGRAVYEGVVELGKFLAEAGDLNGEIYEQILRYYFGVETNFFGSENRQAGIAFIDRALNPDGEATYVTLEAFYQQFDDEFARLARTGDVEAALESTGFFVTTVIGGEEVAFKAVKYGKGLVKIERVTDAGGDAARVADTARSARAGAETVTEVRPQRLLPDDPYAPRPPFAPLSDAAVDLSPPAPGSQMRPGGAVPPIDPRLVRIEGGDGLPVTELKRADGRKISLSNDAVGADGDLLGEGSFTKAFRAPNKPEGAPSVVTKLTAKADDAFKDAVGNNVLAGVDGIDVPKTHARYRTVQRLPEVDEFGNVKVDASGQTIDVDVEGILTVVDETPPPVNKLLADNPDGGLLPDQIAAYRRGTDALNAQGFAFIDNHPGNYTFLNGKLVVLDPGGVIKLKSPEAARALQQAIDAPSDAVRARFEGLTGPGREVELAKFKAELAEQFDDLVDFQGYNDLLNEAGYTGPKIDTLDANAGDTGFQFRPDNGIRLPQLASPPVPLGSPGAALPLPSHAAVATAEMSTTRWRAAA